ncbi:Uncharacterised protein [Pannonibacter phragmitetus]|uniref:N-acetyltransferase domain-containing protein n=2 Tax=Pannonibacter phragmitetus TaxID=121719 RepID=A0A378ZYY6_9HYPH|nr:GNAT family N-acetyltransferase [Pannonibacter phragmitetus]SUB02436.1 Uncharacterised protein [Pannonibacter phragmitetus]
MHLTEPIEIRPCRPDDLPRFAPLTAQGLSATLREGLSGAEQDRYCHLGLWLGDIPAGLLLSRRSSMAPGEQELLSVMVLPLLRRQHLALRLLEAFASKMKAEGRTRLATLWSERLPQGEAFASLLTASGWLPAAKARLRMAFHVGERHDALPQHEMLMHHLERRGLVLKSLASLDAREEASLSAATSQLTVRQALPAWADPQLWQEGLDREVSQVLLSAGGEPAGWLLAQHHSAPGRWTLPCGWLSPSIRWNGALIAGMGELLARLEEIRGPQSSLILQPTTTEGARVCLLLDRRFRSYAMWADSILESHKALG